MPDNCPDCGGALHCVDRDTSGGSDMREYACVKCGKTVIEDGGIALWQAMSDAREHFEQQEKEKQKEPPKPAKKPWWKFF